jgi:hypothetical protein
MSYLMACRGILTRALNVAVACLLASSLVACGGGEGVEQAQQPQTEEVPGSPMATSEELLAGYSGQAYRMYQAAFNRAPDAQGLAYYVDKLSKGQMTLKSMAAGFYNSPEFKERYGTPGINDFIYALYNNVLGRNPDVSGLFFHSTNLALKKLDYADTLVSFSESSENKTKVAAKLGATPGGTTTQTSSGTTAPGGSASTDTGWSDWLFVDSDKAVQVRYQIYDRRGDYGVLQMEYRVNSSDRIHCRYLPTRCTHYVLVANHLGDGMHSYVLGANTADTLVEFRTRQLKFPGGYELTWSKSQGIVHTQNGRATGSLWSTDCVDDIFPGGSIARSRCQDFNPRDYVSI